MSKVWGVLSTVGGAFLGGAGGYLTTQLDTAVPSTAHQWHAVEVGALVAGIASLGNLLMRSPLQVVGGAPSAPEVKP